MGVGLFIVRKKNYVNLVGWHFAMKIKDFN